MSRPHQFALATALALASACVVASAPAVAGASAAPVAPAASSSGQPRAAAASPAAARTLRVDFARSTGRLQQGATGGLYAMSQNGVPSANTVSPLRIHAVAQKPSGSVLHPGGDVDHVAPEFFGAGGKQMFIYMQDLYSTYPYPYEGSAGYSKKVDEIAADVTASPYRRRFVYVPFNEPDITWYTLQPGSSAYQAQLAKFLGDWLVIVRRIRADDPGAQIAGPNIYQYNPTVMRDFLTFAKKNRVLPDVTTWHELNTGFFTDWYAQYASYRALEKRLGVARRPIDIDEYSERRDDSVPGQIIQYLARFEASKVDAMQPYWDISENLNDNVVRDNEADGDWWLMQWYAGLTGHAVSVTPPQPDTVDTLQGIASLDPARRQGQVLLGGGSGDATLSVQGLTGLGKRVRVEVQRTTWSGYDAAAPTPPVVASSIQSVRGGRLTVHIAGSDPAAAYRVLLSPAGPTPERVAVTAPASTRYEAEDATVVDAPVSTEGVVTNANVEHASGNQDVGPLATDDASVAFHVTATHAGRYDASVLYGVQDETMAVLYLRVDGAAWRRVDFASTANYLFKGRKDIDLRLGRGSHLITLATRASRGPFAASPRDGEVQLDALDLTELPATARAQPQTYQAQWAELPPAARVVPAAGSADGAAVELRAGRAEMTFVVTAAEDGYARLVLRGPRPNSQIRVNGAAVTTRRGRSEVIAYLRQGINLVAVGGGNRRSAVSSLSVTPAPARGATRSYQAEAAGNELAGGAQTYASPFASGGAAVRQIGDGGVLRVSGVVARAAGVYELTVRYANDARVPQPVGYNYNAALIDLFADISVDGGPSRRVYFRNTYSWESFWTETISLRLKAGTHTIAFANAAAPAPVIDRIDLSPAAR